MNCEHAEERLSAYLDNMLAPDERREMAIHLQACPQCMMSLAELRQNDILLNQLPRVSPHPALRERIFSTPEMLALTGTANGRFMPSGEWTRPLDPRRQTNDRPQLVSLPGGRSSQTQTVRIPPTPPKTILHPSQSSDAGRTQKSFPLLKIAVAAIIIVAIGTASLFALNLHSQAITGTGPAGAITPPASGPGTGQAGPLAAGTRFVFLRDGALWSTLVDGSNRQPERLTPPNVNVASDWAVSPTMAGHTAGDMLAYIDLSSATVHTIRSDGQQDTTIQQQLLKTGTPTASVWETATGETILNSLAWSKDGSMLAFVGNPVGNGQLNLYIYSTETGKVQKVALSLKGSVAHPVWSPDPNNGRLAFEVAHDGVVSILDYNVQNQGVLDLTNLAAAEGNGANDILNMGWSPSISEPAVTWSLGTIGHISSLWIHYVGTGGTSYPQLLLHGDYAQALYSQNGDNGVGSWLLVATMTGLAGDIWRMDLTPGARLVPLSRGKQVSFARWSPDGSSIFYLDVQTNGVGSGYIVNATSGVNQFISNNVAVNPTPAWSEDSHQLAYSTGTRINIVNTQNGNQVTQLQLHGMATSLSWSPATAHQLVVALGDNARGIYLVDTTHYSSQQLDRLGTNSQIQWTEIP